MKPKPCHSKVQSPSNFQVLDDTNKKDYCLFCKTTKAKIIRHLREMHKYEKEISSILELNNKKEELKALILIKNKGNHEQNCQSIDKATGPIRLSRKPKGYFKPKDYTFCPYCFKWLLNGQLADHEKKNCSYRKSEKPLGKKEMKKRSAKLLLKRKLQKDHNDDPNSDELLVECLDILATDEVGMIIRGDELIRSVGKRLLGKILNEKVEERFKQTNERLRELGRLLKHLRKQPGFETKPLEFFINVKHYRWTLEVIRKIALDVNKNQLARNLGFQLKKAAKALYDKGIGNNQVTLHTFLDEKQIYDFVLLFS